MGDFLHEVDVLTSSCVADGSTCFCLYSNMLLLGVLGVDDDEFSSSKVALEVIEEDDERVTSFWADFAIVVELVESFRVFCRDICHF